MTSVAETARTVLSFLNATHGSNDCMAKVMIGPKTSKGPGGSAGFSRKGGRYVS